MYPEGISVIICTYNGSKRMEHTLEALKKQNIPKNLNWEIILIDNASTDDTYQKMLELSKTLFNSTNFRIFKEPKPGKAHALYKAYEEAHYELMLVCDDDNWLQPDYLRIVNEVFKNNPDIALLGGYGIAHFGNLSKPKHFDTWQHCFACGKYHKTGFLKEGDISIWGAGSVLRKSAWLNLKKNGFSFLNSITPGKAMGEDVDIAKAVSLWGYKLYFDERLWFYHNFSDGRFSDKNLMIYVKNNFRNSALLILFLIADKHYKKPLSCFNKYYGRMLLSLSINLFTQFFKINNTPTQLRIFMQLTELATHRKKYTRLYKEVLKMYLVK